MDWLHIAGDCLLFYGLIERWRKIYFIVISVRKRRQNWWLTKMPNGCAKRSVTERMLKFTCDNGSSSNFMKNHTQLHGIEYIALALTLERERERDKQMVKTDDDDNGAEENSAITMKRNWNCFRSVRRFYFPVGFFFFFLPLLVVCAEFFVLFSFSFVSRIRCADEVKTAIA